MASGMWPRGRRHKAVMHEAAVCLLLFGGRHNKRARQGAREAARELREGRGIDKTGAELDTPRRESSSRLGSRGNREMGHRGRRCTHFRCDATTSKSLF